VQVGDLVIEKTRMSRKPDMGIVLKVDHTQEAQYPYQVYFFDGETCWMQERFVETVSENQT